MWNETNRSKENTSSFLMRTYRYCYLVEYLLVIYLVISCGIFKCNRILKFFNKLSCFNFDIKYQKKIYHEILSNTIIAGLATLLIAISYSNYWKTLEKTDWLSIYGCAVDISTLSYLFFIVFIKFSETFQVNLMLQYVESFSNYESDSVLGKGFSLHVILDLSDEFNQIFGSLITGTITMLSFYHVVRVKTQKTAHLSKNKLIQYSFLYFEGL